MKEKKQKRHQILQIILGLVIASGGYAIWVNNAARKQYSKATETHTITKNTRMDFVKKRMTDKYCRNLIGKAVKERFDVEPEAIIIEWKDLKAKESFVAGSFMTDWVYKKDKNTKSFYVKIHVMGDSCEHAELVDATVKSINIDNHGYSSLKTVYEIRNGKEIKIRIKPDDIITIGGVKVQMAAQHYPVQEFYTSRKLTKVQMQQVWEHEDRDPAYNMLLFRLPNANRYDWYAKLEEKSLYIQEANADFDQWYEIKKNGKNWSYKRRF